ncbi:bacillithiol biosynthesis deacetylase BshB1 [Mucilaginibacter arboris]|uniref:Bacillithiol biosynthesis deacetylase BshB1 n=1 Tax=Mucilaginibacter arboris TaxID=2682090 RepID=A0A7K1SU86_9SPHI|nr:bacillithiol biosynthesis deacetylase BshB1 [Mucilaginibacter arboris]MVN20885.1 bacillithiol biosynthesis deacetylase BshB1 [Mucilaginibacter arboris]
MTKLDILVLPSHPDDAELYCSGTIAKQIALGKKVGIADLTRGELGTRGTVEIRREEAARAAEILNLTVRENIGLQDGYFKNDDQHQLEVISVIRKYQPEIVITNATLDRHPDHARAADLVEHACFYAGLRKIKTVLDDGLEQEAWRPKMVLNFIQDTYIKPDILVDITPYWPQKVASIKAFKSQFYNPDWIDEPQTYISSPEFMEVAEARAREFGRAIQVKYAEGFTCKRLLGVNDLFNLI